MLTFDYDINTIFIMLGNKCNMNCKYCLQHYSYEEPLTARECNPDIIAFIKNTQCNQDTPIDVRFYGGEPLVYWHDIKNIVEQLRDVNVKFSMISNGKFMTDEITKFFNANNIAVSISYDGYNVMKTRHYDVFKENEDALLSLRNLSVNSVLTPYCLPYSYINSLMDINRKYVAKNGYGIGVTQELIFDIAAVFTDLVNFDYDELKKECQALSNKAKDITEKIIRQEQLSDDEQLVLRYINCLLYPFTSHGEVYSKVACGNGTIVINMDMDGNLYRCHNDNIKLATIYDTLDEYKKVSSANDDIIRDFINTDCEGCEVIDYCQGGCPLISRESRQKSGYCVLRKTLFNEYRKMAHILLEMKP